MDLMQLTAAHNTAALRFAFIASIQSNPANTTGDQFDTYTLAGEAEREAFQAVVDHVPCSVYDLNIKARYLLGRIAMGEPFPHEMAPALLRSIVKFHP